MPADVSDDEFSQSEGGGVAGEGTEQSHTEGRESSQLNEDASSELKMHRKTSSLESVDSMQEARHSLDSSVESVDLAQKRGRADSKDSEKSMSNNALEAPKSPAPPPGRSPVVGKSKRKAKLTSQGTLGRDSNKCPKCKERTKPQWPFCIKCGTPLGAKKDNPSSLAVPRASPPLIRPASLSDPSSSSAETSQNSASDLPSSSPTSQRSTGDVPNRSPMSATAAATTQDNTNSMKSTPEDAALPTNPPQLLASFSAPATVPASRQALLFSDRANPSLSLDKAVVFMSAVHAPAAPVERKPPERNPPKAVKVFLGSLEGTMLGLAKIGDTPARVLKRLNFKSGDGSLLDKNGVALVEEETVTVEDSPYTLILSAAKEQEMKREEDAKREQEEKKKKEEEEKKRKEEEKKRKEEEDKKQQQLRMKAEDEARQARENKQQDVKESRAGKKEERARRKKERENAREEPAAADAVDSNKKCPRCSSSVPSYKKFCVVCGCKVPKAPQTAAVAVSVVPCAKCKEPLDQGRKFCVKCGAPTGVGKSTAKQSAAQPTGRKHADRTAKKARVVSPTAAAAVSPIATSSSASASAIPTASSPSCPKCAKAIERPGRQKVCVHCGCALKLSSHEAQAKRKISNSQCQKCTSPLPVPLPKFCLKCGAKTRAGHAAHVSRAAPKDASLITQSSIEGSPQMVRSVSLEVPLDRVRSRRLSVDFGKQQESEQEKKKDSGQPDKEGKTNTGSGLKLGAQGWAPVEFLFEVMLHLDLDSLDRCAAVCKQWYLITDAVLSFGEHSGDDTDDEEEDEHERGNSDDFKTMKLRKVKRTSAAAADAAAAAAAGDDLADPQVSRVLLRKSPLRRDNSAEAHNQESEASEEDGDSSSDVDEALLEEMYEEDEQEGLQTGDRGGIDAVVLDMGSDTIKAGLSGAHQPSLVIPMEQSGLPPDVIHGSPGLREFSMYLNSDDARVWNYLEQTWRQIFNSLKAKPSSHHVVASMPILSPGTKERMLQVLFERLEVAAVCIVPSPILTAYSYGVFSALVVDIGAYQTNVVPIINGYIQQGDIKRVSYISGTVQTQLMSMYLTSEKHKLPGSLRLPFAAKDRDRLANQVKEELCFCPMDYDAAIADASLEIERKFALDKHGTVTLKLHEELVNCGEYLFRPGDFLDEGEWLGIHTIVMQTIKNSPMDHRKPLMQNIVLSGGVCKIKGFAKRLKAELQQEFHSAGRYVNVKAHPCPSNVVWDGGATLTSLPDFQDWLFKVEYDEGVKDRRQDHMSGFHH